MKHVVVPYGASNSTVRTRALHWIDRLAADGTIGAHDVTVHGPEHERASAAGGEPLLLLRNVGRFSRGGRERRLLGAASPGVYDLDDGLPWDDGRLPTHGRWWKRPWPRSRIALAAARASDRVVVGNEVLAEWAVQHCDDVRIVPTCIEPADYSPRTSWTIDAGPVIGWIGSPATEPYLAAIAESLADVHRRTGAVLEVISGPGPVPPALIAFTRRTRWTPSSNRAIGRWDVGVMPLYDGAYERAKCGYKLLQYAASGVPAVGSPVGVNRRLLADMDGFAAETPDEWRDALVELIGEAADRRAQRAAKGFDVARAHSYEVWQSRWVEAVGW